MTKSKSAKRKRNAQVEISRKFQKLPNTITPPPDATAVTKPKTLDALLSNDELETAIDTLNLLSEYPNVTKSKQCKGIRVAVYNFRQACNIGINAACKTALPNYAPLLLTSSSGNESYGTHISGANGWKAY